MNASVGALRAFLSLSMITILFSSNVCLAQQGASRSSVPNDLDWRPLQSHSALEVTEFLRRQTKGNYERIRTWEVTYAKRQRGYASEEEISRWPLKKKITGAVIEEFTETMKISIDMNIPAVYRSEQNAKLKFLKEGSNEEIKGSLAKPVAWNSIVTAEQFIRFEPRERWPNGISELPNNPKTINKRVAFRDPAKKGEGMKLGNLMDPRDFFCFGSAKYFWDDMDDYQKLVQHFKEDKQRVEEICTIEEAVKAGAKWYREKWKGGLYFTIIWNPNYGYHPQSHVCSRDAEGKDVMSSREWQWKTVDNIYIPSYVKERSSRRPDGKFDYEREVQMLDCVLNRPLDPHQFDYGALGLEDGDLIVDNIENIVYSWENGQPEKLGIVGEQYEPPVTESVRGGTRKWLFVTANVVVLTIFIAYALYRFLHKRPKTA